MKHFTRNPIKGKYGKYGGRYVPETLIATLDELEAAYLKLRKDGSFQRQLADYLRHYAGRPTPLYYAANLSRRSGGAKIYLKREDLQVVRSYKIRGAYNMMCSLPEEKLQNGVVCASAGNHAQGFA